VDQLGMAYKMKKLRRSALTALYALALIGAVGMTDAGATVSYQILDGGLESFNVSIDGTLYAGALAGGILINRVGGDPASVANSPTSYVTVCTDIQGTLYLGQTYSYDAPVNFSPTTTGVKPNWGSDNTGATVTDKASAAAAIQNAAALFYTHYSILGGTDKTAKAALQLAVWSALYNTSSSGQITGSRLLFSGGDLAADSLASTWLTGLDTAPNTYKGQLFIPDPLNQGNYDGEPPQELLYASVPEASIVYAPVPEASTVIAASLLLVPFAVGTARAMRKRNKI
jgi:hypothetical protein